MFDSANVHVGGSHFNYNVNAVSGTIRKSHPKSRMIVRNLTADTREFNNDKPTTWNQRTHCEEKIIVLQTMLIGDGKALIEYVKEEDFEEGWC